MSEFIAVMVPPEMKEILRKWSEASGDRGISSIVRQLIEEGIARHYRQLPLVADGDETPDEAIEQMKSHDCGPLPLVEA